TALQRLLGLGSIDELRADLQKARTELKRTKDDAAAKLKQAEAALKARSVDPKKDAVLEKLGKLASSCGFDEQDDIDDYLRLDATHVDVLNAASRWTKAHPDAKTCPICEKKIAADALEEKIEKTLADLQEHAARFSGAEKGARDVGDTVSALFQERTRWRNKG